MIQKQQTAFFAPLGHLSVIRASGADALTFLHGQFTNDLNALSAGQLQLNGYCSPKGRLLAAMHVARSGDELLLITPTGITESLLKRLRMFVMRAAVTLELDDSVQVMGLSTVENYPEEVAERPFALGKESAALVLVPTEAIDAWQQALETTHQIADANQWTAQRILAGEGTIHPETQDDFIPQMLNMDFTDGVSFKKGCYPGQEIIARTRYLGKVKKRLAIFTTDAIDQPPATPIFAKDQEQAVGALLEIATHDGQSIVSAVVRTEHNNATLHLGNLDGPQLTPHPLPYSTESK